MSTPSMELAAGCPWSTLPHASIHFCEDNVCAWVTQPANAWSSMAFVLVGLYLMFEARRASSAYLRLFGPTAIAIGLTSFAYHASFSFPFQVLDLSSMYCFSALLVVMNARRAGLLEESRVLPMYAALVLGSAAAVIAFKVVGPVIFAAQVLAAIELERRARKLAPANYTAFIGALALFAFSFGIWNLDYHRIWCDPSHHVIQGHAIWHVLNAFVLIALYRFYAQFKNAPGSLERQRTASRSDARAA